MSIKLCGIVAIDRNNVIGCEVSPEHPFGIPWKYSHDLENYHDLTDGFPKIAGPKTAEILKRSKKLSERLHVATRETLGVTLEKTKDEAEKLGVGIVWVVGGAWAYNAYAPQVDEWVVTTVEALHMVRNRVTIGCHWNASDFRVESKYEFLDRCQISGERHYLKSIHYIRISYIRKGKLF